MSDRATRIWIAVLSVVAIAIFLVATGAWALQGWCDNADHATQATVRCQGPWGGHSWMLVQSCIVVLGAGAMLAGIGWSLWRAQFRPLSAAAAFSAVAFVAVFLIGSIHVGPEPAPRLSAVRVLDPICPDRCAGGLRVAFTNERRAAISFSFHPDPDAVGSARRHRYVAELTPRGGTPQLAAVDFEGGTHLVGVELLDRSYPGGRSQPLRSGRYSLEITADLPNPISDLNQSNFMVTETRGFTVSPARRP